MKNYSLILLALIALVCTGCPIGLDYSIGTPGTEAIDKKLIGTWTCEAEDPEVKRVRIDRLDDNSYVVEVLERGSMYALETDKLSGWVTTLDNASFVYLKPEGEEKFYHYQYHFEDKALVTNDVSLLDGGVDALSSTETLRQQVSASMKMDEWADETLRWNKD